MSLFLDIGTGAGLAGATGVRPFLPPLIAGALARADAGIDFSHTPYSFLESPAFLACVFAAAVVSYVVERRRASQPAARQPADGGRRLDPIDTALALLALALGALLFAGTLSQAHREGWPGLLAGVACAALGYFAVAALFARARRRVQGGAAALLDAYADGIALILAGIAILLPPVGLVALVAFVVLIVRARGERGRKFEGLRILR